MTTVQRGNLLLIFLCFLFQPSFGQQQKIADSIALILQKGNHSDSKKMELLAELSFNEIQNPGKGIQYAEELLTIALKNGNSGYQRTGFFLKGTKLRLLGDLEGALNAYFKSGEIAKELKNTVAEGEVYGAVADIYSIAGNFDNAYTYYHKAINTIKDRQDQQISLATFFNNAGDLFLNYKRYDSALLYFTKAKSIFEKEGDNTGIAYCLGNLGMVHAGLGNNTLAEANINKAIQMLEEAQDYYPICVYLISLAEIFEEKGEHKIALEYARRSLELAEKTGLKKEISDASLKLSEWYEKQGKEAEAYPYYKKHIAYRDSINNLHSVQKLADLRTNYEVSQKQAEVNLLNQQKLNQRTVLFSLGIVLTLTLIILVILFRNNQQKRKAFLVLNEQKKETELQRAKAEDALKELKQTQKQLIQSAKMASLGELTSGIAHEIKNPLNFINNFSEVSIELLEELKEMAVAKLPETERDDAENLIKDLESNLDKILQHGKKADSIVKGMLQHTGHSTGQKELINVNGLIDEYVRLAYHSLPPREKNLVPPIRTSFDQSIGQIEIVPHDFGRVLLNIFQNAYYAVLKKKDSMQESFVPEILVTTQSNAQGIEIRIRDNGTGIPGNVLEKVFQPFFTTKPAGQGTGLGLSLCYDIIAAHGGSIKVESNEGVYTEFIIQLQVARQGAG